jgi:cytochrome c oxidase subunit I+III
VTGVPDPTGHAFAAVSAALLAFVGIHAFIGALLAAYGAVRARNGYVSARRTVDLRIGDLWHMFTAGVTLSAMLLLFGLGGAMAP